MVINAMGETLVPETLITDAYHLHRGDDAFALNGKAGWITGNAADKSLTIHLVDASLNLESVVLD